MSNDRLNLPMVDELGNALTDMETLTTFHAFCRANLLERIDKLENVLNNWTNGALAKMSQEDLNTDQAILTELEKLGSEHLKTCTSCTKGAVRHYLGLESPVDNIRAQQLLEKSETLIDHSNKVLAEIDKTPQQKAKALTPYMIIMYLIVLFAEFIMNWNF